MRCTQAKDRFREGDARFVSVSIGGETQPAFIFTSDLFKKTKKAWDLMQEAEQVRRDAEFEDRELSPAERKARSNVVDARDRLEELIKSMSTRRDGPTNQQKRLEKQYWEDYEKAQDELTNIMERRDKLGWKVGDAERQALEVVKEFQQIIAEASVEAGFWPSGEVLEDTHSDSAGSVTSYRKVNLGNEGPGETSVEQSEGPTRSAASQLAPDMSLAQGNNTHPSKRPQDTSPSDTRTRRVMESPAAAEVPVNPDTERPSKAPLATSQAGEGMIHLKSNPTRSRPNERDDGSDAQDTSRTVALKALDVMLNREEDLRKAKDYCNDHFGTYHQQLHEFRVMNAARPHEDMESSFGPIFCQRGQIGTQRIIQAEEELKQARLAAKDAGVLNPNSPEQESEFLSVVGEGPHTEYLELQIQNCNRKRIQE